jgi:hypothetical protein
MTRLPRTIQLDPSDKSVFDHAAEPGEWAVTGSFAFLDVPLDALTGKRKRAFEHGWLGTGSFGWSTLVMVSDASPELVAETTEALARHFVAVHGAPGMAAAREVAAREVAFAASVCDHPVGTLLTIFRQDGLEGVVEQFATVTRDQVPDAASGSDFGEPIDLLALAGLKGPGSERR